MVSPGHAPAAKAALAKPEVVATAAVPPPHPAGHFSGSTPIPANDALWVLVDGGDAVSGSTRTIDAAERFARDVLGLVPDRSLFRISAPSRTFAQLESFLGKSGPVARAAGEVKPSVVVFIMVGGTGQGTAGLTFGGSVLPSAWIGARLADLRTVSPDSLLVASIEPLPLSAPEEILKAADTSSAPFHLLAGTCAGPNGTLVSLNSYLAEIGRADKKTSAMAPDLANMFRGNSDAPVALVGALFITALAGAADNTDGLGYDINKVASWVTSVHSRVAHRLDRRGRNPGQAFSRAIWPGNDSDAATRYLIRRAQMRIGVCASASELLPAAANESFDAQLKRTRS
jgi:hypothetical protein